MSNEKVFLAGASGTMGFEAFKRLWKKRNKHDIVLLQRPSEKNKELFKPYELKAGTTPIKGEGIVENDGFKIVWGDATNKEDIFEACEGINYCLCPMALISPAADRKPDLAKKINTTAIEWIVEAIEKQNPENIKLIYIGSVAETGDRLPPIHMGRIGDPLKPSIFDFYATTKIAGERAVLESDIKHWASLRQTFVMVPEVLNLQDSIMFHQPINTYMENITAKDSGRLLIKCLDIPEESDFWRKCYNVSGGPKCRITYLEFMKEIYEMLGMDYREVMERQWFALKNFHMQFYEDASDLNEYTNHWEESQTMSEYFEEVQENMPWYFKMLAKVNKYIPPIRWLVQKFTKRSLKKMAESKEGTLGWVKNNMDMRVQAFYGSYDKFESIPEWGVDMPELSHEADFNRLDHGYDETKESLELEDLQEAAEFRGGRIISSNWDGDMYTTLSWECAFGHEFKANPYTVLKGGHWCPKCAPSPWNYGEVAEKNPFFAQVWYPNHGEEKNYYPKECYKDIVRSED